MSVLFAVPTLYERHKRRVIHHCLNALLRQAALDHIICKIVIICPQGTEDLKRCYSDQPLLRVVENPVLCNIGSSLNLALQHQDDFRFFCFIHDDIMIYVDSWMTICSQLTEQAALRCGVLGLRRHRKGATYLRVQRAEVSDGKNMLLEEHTWTDGIMWLSMETVNRIGMFDEQYQGDCESEDYNYRARALGLRNYILPLPFDHFQRNFFWKKGIFSSGEYLRMVNRSRVYHQNKWGEQKAITQGQATFELLETRPLHIFLDLCRRKLRKFFEIRP